MFTSDVTRRAAQAEKQKNRVQERYEDLEDEDITYLIKEAKNRLRTAKLQNAFDKRCEEVSYSGVQDKLLENKGARNLKLYNTYRQEWTERQEQARDILSKSFSRKPDKQKAFAEARVSILEHAQKVRSKNELNDIVTLL